MYLSWFVGILFELAMYFPHKTCLCFAAIFLHHEKVFDETILFLLYLLPSFPHFIL